MPAEKTVQKLLKGWEPKPRVLGFIYHEAENSDQQQQSYPCCRHVLKALLKSQDRGFHTPNLLATDNEHA